METTMSMQDVINRLTTELTIPISRPKIYHYDRKGVFGTITRGEWGDRRFTEEDYGKVKVGLLLSELKLKTKDIAQVLNEGYDDELMSTLKMKKKVVQYLINELA